jgi:osmotically inducible protein OsmC
MATRSGSARWDGDLTAGSGRLTVGEGVWTGDYSYSRRFAGVDPNLEGADLAGTNPEEVLAAAHAACFSMALSLALTEAGQPPCSIKTDARVHLRIVEGIPTIQRIDLETVGDVPGLAAADFQRQAEEAKSSCIISRALGGVKEIRLAARLASRSG